MELSLWQYSLVVGSEQVSSDSLFANSLCLVSELDRSLGSRDDRKDCVCCCLDSTA